MLIEIQSDSLELTLTDNTGINRLGSDICCIK